MKIFANALLKQNLWVNYYILIYGYTHMFKIYKSWEVEEETNKVLYTLTYYILY